MFSILPGKSGDFPPFLHTKSSWTITPSERSKSFIGNAGSACNKLSTQENRRRRLDQDASCQKGRCHSHAWCSFFLLPPLLGKRSMSLAGGKAWKMKIYRHKITITCKFWPRKRILRKDSMLKKERGWGGFLEDTASSIVNQLTSWNQIYFPL